MQSTGKEHKEHMHKFMPKVSEASAARQQNMQFLSLFLIPMMMAMVHSTRRNYGEKRQLMDDLKCFQLVARLEMTQTA